MRPGQYRGRYPWEGFTLTYPDEIITIRPEGEGENPIDWSKPLERAGKARRKGGGFRAGWAAQLFVGLNVGTTPTWKPEQIRDAVLKFRVQQVREAVMRKVKVASHFPDDIEVGASVSPQLGFWGKISHKASRVVKERSVSVLIWRLGGEGVAEFKDNMEDLGYALAEHFRQEAVIVQLVKSGVIHWVLDCRLKNKTRGG